MYTYLPTEIQHELMRFTGLNTSQLLRDPSQQLAFGYVSGNPLNWVDPFGLAEAYIFDQNGNGEQVPVTDTQRDELKRARPQTADGYLATESGDKDVYEYTHLSSAEKRNILIASSLLVGPKSFALGLTLNVAAETINYNETSDPDEYVGSGITKVGGIMIKPLKPFFDAIENFNVVNSITSMFSSDEPCPK